MGFEHETLVAISKTYGLFYMIGIFAGAVIYALWPSNQEKFDNAANSVLLEDDE